MKMPLCRSFQQARLPATKSSPTFEDLTIDDRLSEKQRVLRYTKSSIGLQRFYFNFDEIDTSNFVILILRNFVSIRRLVHIKMLGDVAVSVGYACNDCSRLILPLLLECFAML